MKRRVMGIETELGLFAAAPDGRQALEAEAAARELFRPVVAWGRSSNVFLTNGSRLYLDVGSHPEHASAECDDPWDLVAQDKAGEREFVDLQYQAEEALAAKDTPCSIHLFKNNADSEGNSFGSHENYLIERRGEFTRLPQILLPFLVTRQIVTGAGGILETEGGPVYGFSTRADYMWETVSSATTRARPIINTRDEPHGDPTRFRRLHVISGDSTMSEISTWLRFAMTSAVLRLIEDGRSVPGVNLADPITDIRTVARDLSARTPLALEDGGTTTALDVQYAYLHAIESAYGGDLDADLLPMWRAALEAVDGQDFSAVKTTLDWAIKKDLLDAVCARRGIDLASPEVRRLDLAYHDIDPRRGLFYALQRRGLAPRVLSESRIAEAREYAPRTTRAHLRSQVLHASREAGVDVAVDWTTVRMNTPGSMPISLMDPFETQNQEISALLDTLRATHPDEPGWKGLP